MGSETERLIQDALERLLKDRTSSVIAHRLSTILHADQILIIEDGKIVERGKPADLLASDGVYRQLYEAQYEESGQQTAVRSKQKAVNKLPHILLTPYSILLIAES